MCLHGCQKVCNSSTFFRSYFLSNCSCSCLQFGLIIYFILEMSAWIHARRWIRSRRINTFSVALVHFDVLVKTLQPFCSFALQKPKETSVPPQDPLPSPTAKVDGGSPLSSCSHLTQACLPQFGCCDPQAFCHCRFFNAICFCRRFSQGH